MAMLGSVALLSPLGAGAERTRVARMGGLVAGNPNPEPFWRAFRNALRELGHVEGRAYVDESLRGAEPADLPVRRPTGFELVVNAEAAAALGLTLPPSLLARAAEAVE